MTSRVKHIIQFIEQLTVPSGKGEGKPFKLRPFQKRFISDVYGPVKDGKRTVRRAILSVARKNGKSVEIACLALTHLVGPEAVMNGEIYSAANDREQAALIFKYAAQIVRAEPELAALIKIVDSTKTMLCFQNGSVYRAVSAEAGTKFGLNPTVVIYDELAQARNRDLYDALDTSMAAREEPLFIVISTQSNDPQHILSTLIDDGLSGMDPTTVCHLYAVPDGAENVFVDEKLWKLANPALGDFRSLSEMRTAAKRAVRMPTFEAAFRNLYLNQRTNVESPLIPRQEWLACKGERKIEKGSEIYLGLDLSGTNDLTALVAVSSGPDDVAQAWFWKPQDTLVDHEKRDRVPYIVWKNQGFIETTPGKSIDYDWVAHRIGLIIVDYKVKGLAFDRWAMKYLIKALSNSNIDCFQDEKDEPRGGALRLVDWGQGYASMNGAVTSFETSVLQRKLIHGGNPVLTWNISNAMVISDPAGNRKIDKSKTRFRIDGAQALIMAIGLKNKDMMKEPMPFVYVSGSISNIESYAKSENTEPKSEKIFPATFCVRCEKDTQGKDFCPNCGMNLKLLNSVSQIKSGIKNENTIYKL
jgi:phage terminase large subunit-like protein